MQSCTSKIVGMLLMHKQGVDNQQVRTNKILGMFSLGYSLLINLGPVGEWGRLPTCHSGLILTTVRY